MGLFPSHQPELIFSSDPIKLALRLPLPSIEMRINAAVSGFLPLCFLIYLELGRRDGRRGSRWLSVTDGLLSSDTRTR